ncbi:ferredoxin [Mycobacterium antarcticum]|uniref:ferredoxin n=1 Tax=unclassified Mycolicibacterium TaxID=2636767 RepID=UPI0024E0CC69|nr:MULTISPECIES: ferredoxin [unclassified Mycolicibacterium]
MRILVDESKCVGVALCENRLPQLFEVSDDGFVIANPGDVPADLLGEVRLAVEHCPSGALGLVD